MNVIPLKAVGLSGLLLVALCGLSSVAVAKGPEQEYRGSAPTAVGTSSSSVPDGQCPCNAGLPQAPVANASAPAECPCNAGLPDGPTVALSAQGTSETTVSARTRTISSSRVSDAQCPCNVSGGPPGGLAELLRTTGSAALRSAGAVPARRVGVVHAQSSRTFDWADASVGAGVTAGIGLLILAGASLSGRRRVRGQLPAS